MKYKIGDEVTLRKDLQDGETYNGITLWEGIKAILEAEPYLEIISINEIGTVMNLDTIDISSMKSPENNPNYIVHKYGNPYKLNRNIKTLKKRRK